MIAAPGVRWPADGPLPDTPDLPAGFGHPLREQHLVVAGEDQHDVDDRGVRHRMRLPVASDKWCWCH